jgi:hypothetical protein
MNTIYKAIFLIWLVIYFTGCSDKSLSESIDIGIYCEDVYTIVCTKTCDNKWSRRVDNKTFIYDTEDLCKADSDVVINE